MTFLKPFTAFSLSLLEVHHQLVAAHVQAAGPPHFDFLPCLHGVRGWEREKEGGERGSWPGPHDEARPG